MDFLKKAAGSAGHSGNNEAPGATGGAPGAAPAQQKDYGDKAFDAAIGKSGYGDKVSDSNREKITDAIRGQYEKATGSKVNPKFSN